MLRSEAERARSCAFYYLNKRRYTRHGLRTKLLERGYGVQAADAVLDDLEEAGYIDDHDYAVRYIKDAVRLKQHGKQRIRADLAQKGIPRELADAVFDELDLDYSAPLRQLVQQRGAGLDLSDEKQKNRLVGFLIRRGYSMQEIMAAIRENTD